MLITIALGCMILCACMTIWSARHSEDNGGQSIKDSMAEAWQNIAIGFSINYVANIFIIPMVAEGMTLAENFWIGCIYTAISMVRSFGVRRYNDGKERAKRAASIN